MNLIRRLRSWTMRLPTSWGLGQADIHSSLLITITVLSGVILLLSLSRPGFRELSTLAVTLPIVWVVSLAVRIAAQQLSIGGYSLDMTTTVGPTGNLSTDYEYLPTRRIIGYASAGQLATVGLIMLGMVVNAAIMPSTDDDLQLAQLLDLVGGWESRAWATQIMWVNLFIGVLNLLPTVPFDMRAAVFAMFSKRSRNAQEPIVFRRIAAFDSHLAALMLGAGSAVAITGLVFEQEIAGWYAAVAAAVYLFVASCWEVSRAEDIEEQYAPIHTRIARKDPAHSTVPQMRLERRDDPVSEIVQSAKESAEGMFDEFSQEADIQRIDVDEILRKLHREGARSLSIHEQEALLSASRQLKEKRKQE
jgi:hypothetical protein